MSLEEEHELGEKTTKVNPKKVVKAIKRSRPAFIPNAKRSAANIKAKLAERSKSKTQIGFD